MSKAQSTQSSSEHAAAAAAAKAKAHEAMAKDARRELDAADKVEGAALVKVAERMFNAGSLVDQSGLSDRAFAILAEHGKDAFAVIEAEAKANGKQAQPRRLTSYRRARVIFTACDAVEVDAAEMVATFTVEAREAGISPTVERFADYCAAGMKLPDVKGPRTVTVKALAERVAAFGKGMSAAELAEAAHALALMAKAAAKAEAKAAKGSPDVIADQAEKQAAKAA